MGFLILDGWRVLIFWTSLESSFFLPLHTSLPLALVLYFLLMAIIHLSLLKLAKERGVHLKTKLNVRICVISYFMKKGHRLLGQGGSTCMYIPRRGTRIS